MKAFTLTEMLNKHSAPKLAMAMALLLAVGKGAVGFMSGSVAVLSSALDSLLDAVTSAFNYIMIRKAETPPDSDHQFGHGKIEAYASLVQSIIIFSGGAAIMYTAVRKFFEPEHIRISPLILAVLAAAIVVSIVTAKMLELVGARENSVALKADALHYAMDVISNAFVLAAMLVIKLTGALWIDHIIGGFIAVYIMYQALKLHFSTLQILLDRKIPREQLAVLKKEFKRFSPYQQDFHQLRTRTDGSRIFADVHITLCKELTLEQAHEFIDIMERNFKKSGVEIDLTVHPEPCDGSCKGTAHCKRSAVESLLVCPVAGN